MTASLQRRKRFGQVFTPSNIASLMADWVMAKSPEKVLDPAFGKGALIAACMKIDSNCRFYGYEIDPLILEEIPKGIQPSTTIALEDFLKVPIEERFDAIIANPPYIRHRELEGHLEIRRNIEHTSECTIPRSANLYVDFLVKSTLHLKKSGRAAFLIPAEWMSANFSKGLKNYLLDKNLLHSLITFSNCSNIFNDALTTASLVLLEKSEEPRVKINSYFLQSIDASQAPTSLNEVQSTTEMVELGGPVLRDAKKWEPILRGDDCRLPPGWTTLGELVTTSRGIATGANKFFLISQACINASGISSKHAVPCVGTAKDVKGLFFTEQDFDILNSHNANIWLLNFSINLSPYEREYINSGEEQGVHERYITRNRKIWYTMEQREPAQIWAGVFGRGDLRFIYNEFMARSLTNFHCVYPKVGGTIFHKALVAVLNSSPVKLLMKSHMRGYGGGLIKFEPKDLLSVPIPDLRTQPTHVLEELAEQLPIMHNRVLVGENSGTDRVNAIVMAISEDIHANDYRLVG